MLAFCFCLLKNSKLSRVYDDFLGSLRRNKKNAGKPAQKCRFLLRSEFSSTAAKVILSKRYSTKGTRESLGSVLSIRKLKIVVITKLTCTKS